MFIFAFIPHNIPYAEFKSADERGRSALLNISCFTAGSRLSAILGHAVSALRGPGSVF